MSLSNNFLDSVEHLWQRLMASSTKIDWFVLPGFLGIPSDWQPLAEHFRNLWPQSKMNIVDLQSIYQQRTVHWQAWPEVFDKTYPFKDGQRWLMGYSLGGRLALALLAAHPEMFSGAVILSAHPGLISEQERRSRWVHDQTWARRWITDSWGRLISDWNNQEVLKTSPPLQREEAEVDRATLARILTGFSLAHQPDYRPLLQKVSAMNEIHWWVGERDQKFCLLAQEVARQTPQMTLKIFSNQGHRFTL